jgi:hypothetical protein
MLIPFVSIMQISLVSLQLIRWPPAIYHTQVETHTRQLEVVLDQHDIDDIFESGKMVYITCECQKNPAHFFITYNFTVKGVTQSGAQLQKDTWFWPLYSINVTYPTQYSIIKMGEVVWLKWWVYISRNTIGFFTSNFSRTAMNSNIPESKLRHSITIFRVDHSMYKGELDIFFLLQLIK